MVGLAGCAACVAAPSARATPNPAHTTYSATPKAKKKTKAKKRRKTKAKAACADVGGRCLSSPIDVTFAADCEQDFGLKVLAGTCTAINQTCCG